MHASSVVSAKTYEDTAGILKVCKPRVLLLENETQLGPAFRLLDLCCDQDFHVILLTRGKQPVLRALRYYIFDMLSLPVDGSRVYDTVQRALNIRSTSIRERFQRCCEGSQGPELSHVYIPENTGMRFVPFFGIIRIRRMGAGTEVFLTGGKTVRSSQSIRFFAKCLPREQFGLTNKDLIVNNAYVHMNKPGKPLIMSDVYRLNEESYGEPHGS